MTMLLSLLAWITLISGFVGWIWIVVIAFSNEEVLWGIGSIFVPFVAPIYGFLNLGEAKIPLILYGVGFAGNILLTIVGLATGA